MIRCIKRIDRRTMLESEYRIAVIENFQQLLLTLNKLASCITQIDEHLPAWFDPPLAMILPSRLSYREKIVQFLGQLEFLNDQLPREILIGAGLVAASSQTLKAITELNQAKDNFKQAILSLKQAKIKPSDQSLTEQLETLLPVRSKTIAATLTKFGLSRLHLKQCYRRIPFFTVRPEKVAWTWANTRSIKRITIEQAADLLSKQGCDHKIQIQQQKLQNLPPNEPLAVVQELAPHLRANIVLPDSTGTSRTMIKGPVPIFYLDDSGQSLPIFQPPGPKKGRSKNRLIRNDVRLDPNPFLPTIRVHRYLTTEESV